MYFLTNFSVMLMLLGQGPHFEWPCFVVFRNHSSLESGSEHVPTTVPEWMNGVLNQSVLAECPALEGPTEKPPTNHKVSNNTINIGEELVQSSLQHKGKGVNSALVGAGWGGGCRGLDLTKEALCSRSERVGQIYPGGDWLKGGGNTGTKVKRQDKVPGISIQVVHRGCEEEVRKKKKTVNLGPAHAGARMPSGRAGVQASGQVGCSGNRLLEQKGSGSRRPSLRIRLASRRPLPGAGRAGAGGSCVRKQ